MFRLTKIKVAGLIVAGAVALGAVGAYAANTVPLGGKPLTKVSGVTPSNGQTLWALPGTTATPPATFTGFGDCVSWYASHKGFVLASGPTAPTTVKKNYHGKLMSNITALCTKTKDSTSADTAEAPEAPEASDSGTPPAWAHSGHGRP